VMSVTAILITVSISTIMSTAVAIPDSMIVIAVS